MTAGLALSLVIGYVLGAIPVGIFAGRALAGIDPREAGSRNIGFTNVLRVAGKTAGAVTLIGDIGKGALAVLCARWLAGPSTGDWELVVGAAVILGHVFPVFLGFRGGKGVATALGVWLAVEPAIGGSILAVWLVAAAIWRMSSLAALMAFGTLPLWVWLLGPQASLGVFATAVIALIIYTHRDNIGRIRAGTEPKFGTGTPANEAESRATDQRV
jgi:acyl phosphate:glycerol-3-phosphate acyltransferase